MDTPARVDLQPPADWLDSSFPLTQIHMYDLQRYVESGRRLPVTPEEYQRHLGLNVSTAKMFEGNITSVVDVYHSISDHCKDFKENTLPATVNLNEDLCAYVDGVKEYHAILYHSLNELEVLYKTENDNASRSSVLPTGGSSAPQTDESSTPKTDGGASKADGSSTAKTDESSTPKVDGSAPKADESSTANAEESSTSKADGSTPKVDGSNATKSDESTTPKADAPKAEGSSTTNTDESSTPQTDGSAPEVGGSNAAKTDESITPEADRSTPKADGSGTAKTDESNPPKADGNADESSTSKSSGSGTTPIGGSSTQCEIKKQREMVNAIVDSDVKTLDAMYSRAAIVIQQLEAFERHTVNDQMAALRQQRSFAGSLYSIQEHKTALSDQVKQLKQLSDENSEMNTNKYWMHLVGWVPKAVLLTKPGKDAADFIYKHISVEKDEAEAREIIYLQGELMMKNLTGILELIKSAIESIQLMQGFFGKMGSDLKRVRDLVNNGFRTPSKLMDLNFKVVKKKWEDLGKLARHYTFVAYAFQGAETLL